MSELLITLALWLGINVWTTQRVLAVAQRVYLPKRMLIGTIWALPFLGALLALIGTPSLRVADSVGAAHDQRDRDEEYGSPPSTLEAPGGAPAFDVQAHLQWGNGLPVMDWQALAAWALVEADESARAAAIDRGRHAWLLHLRHHLGSHMGSHMGLHVTDTVYLLSSLNDRAERSMSEYVATARARIERLLGDVARFPAGMRSIVLVLDDEEAYYRYVSNYYPDGDFATSGGMFIDAGCPHFVVVRAVLNQIEPVIAHELTHAALAHLRLPRWLDEGIAVNTERRVAGPQGSLYTPHELHAMHREHWSLTKIQRFWSGESFFKPGDDTLLSYELARIIVEQMSRDWDGFQAFLRTAAQADDAGAAAARESLGIDLGGYAAALVESPTDDGWSPAPERWSPQAA